MSYQMVRFHYYYVVDFVKIKLNPLPVLNFTYVLLHLSRMRFQRMRQNLDQTLETLCVTIGHLSSTPLNIFLRRP